MKTAVVCEQGSKKKNQDRYLIQDLFYKGGNGGNDVSNTNTAAPSNLLNSNADNVKNVGKLYAVFDGHGGNGEVVAEFVKERFSARCKEPSIVKAILTQPDQALTSLFATIERDLTDPDLKPHNLDCYVSGTTATVAFVLYPQNITSSPDAASSSHPPFHLAVGHVGDTRAVLGMTFEKGEAGKTKTVISFATKDHTCEDEEERQRILSQGGVVKTLFEKGQNVGPLRVFKGTMPYPGLVVTRSFGDDVAHKLGVTADPDVAVLQLESPNSENSSAESHSSSSTLIVASDGLWDLVTPKNAIKFLHKYEDLQEGAKELTAYALNIAADDNLTIIAVRFTGEPFAMVTPPPEIIQKIQEEEEKEKKQIQEKEKEKEKEQEQEKEKEDHKKQEEEKIKAQDAAREKDLEKTFSVEELQNKVDLPQGADVPLIVEENNDEEEAPEMTGARIIFRRRSNFDQDVVLIQDAARMGLLKNLQFWQDKEKKK